MTASGATYKKTRPRGFVPWNMNPESEAIVVAVREVLTEYADYLPLTVRQVFYRLVGRGVIDKSERSYKALAEKLNRARRSRAIPFGAIRDDGVVEASVMAWRDPAEFVQGVANSVATYRREWESRAELWVEAAGMAGMLAPIANAYRVPVFSSGGFDSVTAKHAAAVRIAQRRHPVLVLHVGDLDPSGRAIVDSAEGDVAAFLDGYDRHGWASFARLAVTADQADQYQLPTAPPKRTDVRGEGMTDTVQVEALPPDLLVAIVDQAVRGVVDLEALAEHEAEEAAERDELAARFGLG